MQDDAIRNEMIETLQQYAGDIEAGIDFSSPEINRISYVIHAREAPRSAGYLGRWPESGMHLLATVTNAEVFPKAIAEGAACDLREAGFDVEVIDITEARRSALKAVRATLLSLQLDS